MTLSDKIAERIMALLESSDGETEIQRNNLASLIGCVPSQINYVITSRFTPENGYVVFSRRGGGGYIQIKRISSDGPSMFMHVVNSIGDALDMASLRAMLQSMAYAGLVSREQALLILSATDDNALKPAAAADRDGLRASIAKQMLITIGNNR